MQLKVSVITTAQEHYETEVSFLKKKEYNMKYIVCVM